MEKMAIFHPWIKSKGGGERVVLEIMRNFNADLYTWAYEPEKTFDEFKRYKINILAPRFTKKLSYLKILRVALVPLGILKKIPPERYDLFLISTSGVGEFITFRNYKPGKTYAYIHTPLREADKQIVKWNLDNIYKRKFLKKIFYLLSVQIYKLLEKIAWKKIDILIFNSELSKQRAIGRKLISKQKDYVVNPPVNFKKRNKIKVGKHFLYISRLNPPKRQDILLKAWDKFVKKNPKFSLIIGGTPEGKEYHKEIIRLKNQTQNVEIKLNVSDLEKEKLISESLAGIFLGYKEDFGIFPLEIVSAGKPLIGVEGGGYVYYQGFRGPIKIWKVDYPNNTISHEEFLRNYGEYGELDNLTFTR